MSKTLAQLKEAHQYLMRRRSSLKTRLCPEARAVVGKLPRRPTTDELALLVESPTEEVLEELRSRTEAVVHIVLTLP